MKEAIITQRMQNSMIRYGTPPTAAVTIPATAVIHANFKHTGHPRLRYTVMSFVFLNIIIVVSSLSQY